MRCRKHVRAISATHRPTLRINKIDLAHLGGVAEFGPGSVTGAPFSIACVGRKKHMDVLFSAVERMRVGATPGTGIEKESATVATWAKFSCSA